MQGVICTGIAYYIQGVVMKERGPVFVTAFSPLCMVIVAIMSTIILAEQMFLGRYLDQTTKILCLLEYITELNLTNLDLTGLLVPSSLLRDSTWWYGAKARTITIKQPMTRLYQKNK